MKNLRRLGAAVILTLALALSAFGGQIETPPCAAPEPGQIETPPCSIAPGDMNAPGATAPGDLATATVANTDTSFTELATDVFLNFLSLY